MYGNKFCTGRKFLFFSLFPGLEKKQTHTSIYLPSLSILLSSYLLLFCQPATITCNELTNSLVSLRHPREPDLNPPLPVNHQLKRDQGSPREVLRVMIARGACLTL